MFARTSAGVNSLGGDVSGTINAGDEGRSGRPTPTRGAGDSPVFDAATERPLATGEVSGSIVPAMEARGGGIPTGPIPAGGRRESFFAATFQRFCVKPK